MTTPVPRMQRPCNECPWWTDAEPGRFAPDRWASLAATSYDPDRGSAPLGSPVFACHITVEGADRACAGWLAVEGADHVGMRVAVAAGRLPASALSPGGAWPDLFGSLADAAAHDLRLPVRHAGCDGVFAVRRSAVPGTGYGTCSRCDAHQPVRFGEDGQPRRVERTC